ncbi:uncharacterized protein IWZ02DRAFT_455182 [Phyllosticta citriasiana]|uniref:uncharacterized protein n=1 Tax=Phyllosticta citriasiana TaxID=595635 RepID=UPI0030FD77E9
MRLSLFRLLLSSSTSHGSTSPTHGPHPLAPCSPRLKKKKKNLSQKKTKNRPLEAPLAPPFARLGSALLSATMKDDPDGDYAPRSPDLSAYDSDTVTAFDQKYRGSISHPTPQPHITSQPQTQPQPLPLPPPPPHTPHHAQPYHPPPFANTPGTVPMPSRFGKMKLEAEDHDWTPQNQPHDDMMEEQQPQQQQPPQAQPPSNGLKPHPELAPGVAEGIEVRTKFPAARIKRIMQADEDVGKVAQVTPHVVGE